MKTNIRRTKAASSLTVAIVALLLGWVSLAGCRNQSAQPAGEAAQDSVETAELPTYFTAIDDYLVAELGSQYAKGEYCVPLHMIVGVDESNPDDILVWGDFWVFNYDQVDDTLKTVSGGSHPGLMHVRQVENAFEVTAFDQVEDGSQFLPTAKRIFADKFDAFSTIHSDDQQREQLRNEVLSDYVKKHHLQVSMYQDYGWPAKSLVK